MLWIEPATLDCGDADPDLSTEAAEYATEVLYHLTGRRWPGDTTDVVTLDRANRGPCVCSRAQARIAADSGCACLCGGSARYQLPGFPVLSVTSVAIDGVALEAAAYRVEDRRWLVRLDGGAWPGDGTAVVTYVWGGGPGPVGEHMAAVYACELAKSWTPGCRGCRLPMTATTVARQGVTVTRQSAADLAAVGATGLPEVDAWVAAVLAGDNRRRGRVLSPEDWPNRHRR